MASQSSSAGSSGASSRSSRRNVGLSPLKMPLPARRKGQRRIEYCTEWGLPKRLMCSGCVFYSDSSASSKNKPRSISHSSSRYVCGQPWKQIATTEETTTKKPGYQYSKADIWISEVCEWISDRHNCTLTSTDRIQGLLKSAEDHHCLHLQLAKDNDDYEASVATVEGLMRKQHFKMERVQQKKEVAVGRGNNNKATNALQKKTGVDRTNVMRGLTAYGKLKKALHFEDLATELLFRGCTLEEIQPLNITARKKKLRDLEMIRLEGDDDGIKRAEKAFKSLSTAAFEGAS